VNVWDWFTSTTPAGAVVSGVGVAAFVMAILTDRLMTKGQHDRRVADIIIARDKIVTALEAAHAAAIAELVRHHDNLAAVKELAYNELKASRDYYRQARLEERDRADKVTDQLAEVAELAKLTTHLLSSLDEVAKDTRS
jgi:hypothetical protein